MKIFVKNLATLFLVAAIALLDKGNPMWAFILGGMCSAVTVELLVYASSIPDKN